MHRAFRRAGAVARSAAILALSCCAAGRTAAASVVINEIHYAPADRTVPEEFIELHNAGASAVPLDGWYFSSGVEWTFPAGTSIAPGEHLVIAANPTVLRARYPAARIVGPFLGRLDNDGEEIVLRNPGGFVEDRVDYQRGFPWPVAGGVQGYSIELIHPALDNDLGGSWRLSNPGAQDSSVIVREGEVWRYFKGTAEPSSPSSAWRGRTFGDAAWAAGAAPVGYGESFIRTDLADMRDGYSTVYLRRTFTIDDPASVSALVLDVLYDDGFNAWINGRHVAGDNAPSADAAFNATASGALEDLEFNSFSLPRPVDYLVAGSNALCLQLLNSSRSASSDAFIDARLSRSTGAGAGPTPGAQNSVWATNSPPHLRQVEHTPQVPVNNSPVTVTVKATDADGVASVTLEYQLVDPGAYIALDDPEYSTSWTSVAMNDDGAQGDAIGGDEIFTVVVPRVVQGHRSLVRYRIRAVDGTGLAVSAPYPDDPQPNFAYFVHDGVPGWNGAAQPGSANPILGAVIDYPIEVLRSVRPYFLITKRASTEDCTWFSRYGGDNYLWLGTLVYDGKVYDHVRYRARGGVWRYSMGKNMWKFNFLRGHELEARDDYGRKYDTRWDKLNFSAIIQQGDYQHRGEQGLFESTGFRLFNLVGVASPQTHFATFHIIDEADEFGPTQYDGDLWGLYLVLEQMDGRFLDEHGLPDGNFYKMEGGTGELNNQGPTGATDKSDLNAFLGAYQGGAQSEGWWRANFDLDGYYGYRSIVEAIHHYDIAGGKNYFYYLNPEDGRWSVLPWDLDLTWADNMFGSGDEPFRSRVLAIANLSRDYRNRLREVRDLLFNADQCGDLIDEYAAMVDDPGGAPSLVDVDRARWDYNPVMANGSIVNLGKAGQGRFYQVSAQKTFRSMADKMKAYINTRGALIDNNIANDSAIPSRPTITSLSPAGFPIDALRFRSSSFSDPQGAGSFGAMKWRIGEVALPGAPDFDLARPRPFEIDAVWESPEIAPFANEIDVPDWVLGVGRRYRARVRMRDNTGRWSSWSQPVEFTAGAPAAPFPAVTSLRITELHFHPADDEDYEFIEILNTGAAAVDLEHVSVRGGIDFFFSEGSVASLPAGEHVVVVKNLSVFSTRHDTAGMLIAGEYSGRLGNDGDHVVLKYGEDNIALDFDYADSWYPIADGGGHSLVVADPMQPTDLWSSAAGWRESASPDGSPGRADGGGPAGGLQRPGDGNQDGLFDISDVVWLLRQLFAGGAGPPPCDGAVTEGGNALLVDVDGDGAVDVTDAIYGLGYLFKSGPAPARGTACVRLEGCPSVCR